MQMVSFLAVLNGEQIRHGDLKSFCRFPMCYAEKIVQHEERGIFVHFGRVKTQTGENRRHAGCKR